jgi:very-short-patch-repair endonuclease
VLTAERLETAFESARRMGLTCVRALEQAAATKCGIGRHGSAAIRELLAHQQPGERPLESPLEVKMARLLRASGLPRFERQVRVGKYSIDLGRSTERVGVECEGFDYHGSRLAWKRDKRRTSWIEARGWRLARSKS